MIALSGRHRSGSPSCYFKWCRNQHLQRTVPYSVEATKWVLMYLDSLHEIANESKPKENLIYKEAGPNETWLSKVEKALSSVKEASVEMTSAAVALTRRSSRISRLPRSMVMISLLHSR